MKINYESEIQTLQTLEMLCQEGNINSMVSYLACDKSRVKTLLQNRKAILYKCIEHR
jgi:hypothetical protein